MDDILKKLLERVGLNPPISSSALTDVEAKLRIKFPKQYVDFMMESNGAEGSIGRSYIALWAAEQIVQLNEGYGVNEFTPGLVYFGSDGGGMAYAFDNRTDSVSIVVIPFESIHIEDAKMCGKTFVEFLQYLFNE